MNRRNFVGSAFGWLAALPVVGVLFRESAGDTPKIIYQTVTTGKRECQFAPPWNDPKKIRPAILFPSTCGPTPVLYESEIIMIKISDNIYPAYCVLRVGTDKPYWRLYSIPRKDEIIPYESVETWRDLACVRRDGTFYFTPSRTVVCNETGIALDSRISQLESRGWLLQSPPGVGRI